MIRFTLTFLFAFTALTAAYSQCRVEGLITLKKGDMVPRADVAATVFLIPKTSITKKQSTQLLTFLDIEKDHDMHLLQVAAMGKKHGRQMSEQMKLNPIAIDDDRFRETTDEAIKTFKAVTNAKDVKLVATDVNGRYQLDADCGDYYILVNSNGRLGSRYYFSRYAFSNILLSNGSVVFSRQLEFN